MKIHSKKTGVVLVTIALLGIVVGAVMLYTQNQKTSVNNITPENAEAIAEAQEAKIKHLGINLDYYDPATGKAGDLVFAKYQFAEGGFDTLFMEYGEQMEVSSARPNPSRNPQPTFLAPLGTKVYAIADGEVIDVPQLYSGDYSVMIQQKGSDIVFEMEHVMNVIVKPGDKVTAGDVVAEVSDYDSRNIDGLGLVEIGVLIPGNPPKHACPFDYLDESIKDETLQQLAALKRDWQEYMGEETALTTTVHEEIIPGCASRELIEG